MPLVVRRANLGRAYAVLPAYGSVALGIFGIGLGFVYDRDAAVGGVLIIALMGFTAVVGLFCSLGLTRRTGRKLNARAFTAPAAKTALFGDLLGLSMTSTRSKTTWQDEVNLRPSTQILVAILLKYLKF